MCNFHNPHHATAHAFTVWHWLLRLLITLSNRCHGKLPFIQLNFIYSYSIYFW